jgi:hypothetical protein
LRTVRCVTVAVGGAVQAARTTDDRVGIATAEGASSEEQLTGAALGPMLLAAAVVVVTKLLVDATRRGAKAPPVTTNTNAAANAVSSVDREHDAALDALQSDRRDALRQCSVDGSVSTADDDASQVALRELSSAIDLVRRYASQCCAARLLVCLVTCDDRGQCGAATPPTR